MLALSLYNNHFDSVTISYCHYVWLLLLFIARIRSIAASEKQQEYEDNVKALKLTKLYENNVLFRSWMDKFWLKNAKVYANLF